MGNGDGYVLRVIMKHLKMKQVNVIQNEEGYRDDGFVLVERDDEDKNDICGSPYTICDEKEVRNEVFCIKQCEENPDRNACSKDEQKNHDNSPNVKTNIVSTVTECSDRGFEHGEEGEWGY
jgi:hypothetical protein